MSKPTYKREKKYSSLKLFLILQIISSSSVLRFSALFILIPNISLMNNMNKCKNNLRYIEEIKCCSEMLIKFFIISTIFF